MREDVGRCEDVREDVGRCEGGCTGMCDDVSEMLTIKYTLYVQLYL